MSQVSDAISQVFPDKRVVYLTPRDLDCAIAMAEGKDGEDRLRLLYLDKLVWSVLYNKLKWPYNKINAFFAADVYRSAAHSVRDGVSRDNYED